jgi:hypothetical protein
MSRSLTTKVFLAALAMLPLAGSCDVPIDFWVDKSATINIDASENNVIPTQSQTVDINSVPAISGQANLIKSVQIPAVWVMVKNIQSGNAATSVSGTLEISDPSDATFAPIMISYTNVPIVEGGRLDLTPEQSDVDRLQTLIQTKGKFSMQYSGMIDQLPAQFDLDGEIHIIATISVST